MENIGKIVIITGLAIFTFGVVLVVLEKIGVHLFRLPGDIIVRKENFTFYFPIVTSILISVALTLLFWIMRK